LTTASQKCQPFHRAARSASPNGSFCSIKNYSAELPLTPTN
jgi:hypothetical protein